MSWLNGGACAEFEAEDPLGGDAREDSHRREPQSFTCDDGTRVGMTRPQFEIEVRFAEAIPRSWICTSRRIGSLPRSIQGRAQEAEEPEGDYMVNRAVEVDVSGSCLDAELPAAG